MDGVKQKTQYVCKICDARAPNQSSFECHLSGKKHKQNVERLQAITEEAERSVFVGNCIHLTAAELSLADYFSKFGAIAKITVDKNRGSFAIVEFHKKESASTVLSVGAHHVMGIKLAVKPRETKLPTSKKGEGEKHQLVHQQMRSEIWNMLLQADSVDAQFAAILQNLSLNDDEKHIRNLLCQLLTSALEEVFYMCEIKAFGSSANGIGFHGCDVDLNLSYDFVNYTTALQLFSNGQELDDDSSQIEFGSQEVLQIASSIIKNCVPDCYQVRAILTARRPVVKFRHKASGICCDLSVGNDLAIQNTNYLRHMCDKVPYFTPLVQAIKLWMKHWSLAGSPKAASPLLNNYAVTMLIIFYLTQTEELHSLNEMRIKDESLQPCVIEKWDCSFSMLDPRKKEDTMGLQDLFAGFFKFYAKFEFANSIIHINSGDTEDVKEFTAQSKEGIMAGFKLGHLNIQDPFELNHNVAGNVGQKHMIVFTKCIRNAALACDMKIFNKSAGLTAKEPWGILCLFVDHHVKRSSDISRKEPCTSLTEELEIPDIDEADQAHTVVLILCILTDVFLMSVVSESASKLLPSEPTTGSSESCNSKKISEDLLSNSHVLDGVSRKRRTEETAPSSKKIKLSISSPEALKLYEKACATTIEDEKLSELPLVFKCEVKYRLWEGRRKIRRQLVKSEMQEILDLEKQISKLLVAESHNHEESFMESHTVSDISTAFLMNVRLSLRGASLIIVFAYDKATDCTTNHNTEQDFKNMVHYLKISLVSMVKKCMRNK